MDSNVPARGAAVLLTGVALALARPGADVPDGGGVMQPAVRARSATVVPMAAIPSVLPGRAVGFNDLVCLQDSIPRGRAVARASRSAIGFLCSVINYEPVVMSSLLA
jgi:hypothetical protein